jgi:hypothetical protein
MAGEITISTNETDMRSMMIKLMGRGVTLSQTIEGQFVLTLDDILDLINKISQRVQFQNHCKMSDFYAEFGFQDGSKETIPSLDGLKAYRSVNPTICNSGKLSFAFLIDFHSRGIEKQSVDITISGSNKSSSEKSRLSFLDDNFSLGKIEIKIEYTDVTWANDIKNMFEKYCETHIQKLAFREKVAPFLSTRFVPLAVMPFAFVGAIAADMSKAAPSIKEKLGDYLAGISPTDQLAVVNRKLDVLIFRENETRSIWDLLTPFGIMACIITALVLCAVIIRNVPVSAIVLSTESKKVYGRLEKRRGHSNLAAAAAIFLSIIVSVVASNIDRLILKYWGF